MFAQEGKDGGMFEGGLADLPEHAYGRDF